MPFKDDSPFEKKTGKLNMDSDNGKEIQKPLLEPEGDVHTEGQIVYGDTVESEKEDHLHTPLVKHVHFSESLQRVLEKKEWDEEMGLNKDDDEEEEEEESTWEEFWEWVKAETKCYANYICPVVLVNACILFVIIYYFWSRKN
ncbi:hypothetical protein M758_6G170800 [Ceratodon purpureus]|nr:hypothetical protein M758_6G170800 [Ceratodon purpureus]